METIPEFELQKAEKLILKHHNLFTTEYFAGVETKYKCFINILTTKLQVTKLLL
jgi:hypothetical protein